VAEARGQASTSAAECRTASRSSKLFALLGEFTGATLDISHGPPRDSDQRVFVADLAKAPAASSAGPPRVSARDGIQRMVEWTRESLGPR